MRSLATLDAQQSRSNAHFKTWAELEKLRKKRERDLGIASNVFSTIQIAQTLGLATSLAFDQISTLSSTAAPVLDFFKNNMGAFNIAFSGISVISSVAGILTALKQGGKNEALKALLGEHGLEKIISGVIGCAAGGAMLALASQPVAIIAVAAVSFTLQQVTAISFTIARMVALKKQIAEAQKQHDTLKENHPLRADLANKIDKLNKQVHGQRTKLIASSVMLAAGITAFSLLAVGVSSANPIILGVAAGVFIAMGIVGLVMMAVKVHKKRKADIKAKQSVAPQPASEVAPERASAESPIDNQSPAASDEAVKPKNADTPTDNAIISEPLTLTKSQSEPAFNTHYPQTSNLRAQSFQSYFPNTPDRHPESYHPEETTRSTDQEQESVHRGILGMAMAQRRSASDKVHADDLNYTSPTSQKGETHRIKPNSVSVSARDILTRRQATESQWSAKHNHVRGRSQSLPSSFETKPWPHPTNGG